ncbi:MAG: HAD-IC family P-type ATPase [Erysipelotrichaceae bacterium]|nr:HAD-IC family P-type ATPase [Erysipelotrichaceae bacterium]
MNKVNLSGLNSEAVAKQIKLGNTNTNNHNQNKSTREIIFNNVFNMFNILNILIAILVFITGKYQNMLFIFVAIINSVIAIYQEIKAKKLLDKLKRAHLPKAYVIRDYQEKIIEANELVIGDLMILKTGDEVLCDGRIINGEMEVNEAIITGESESINKKINDEVLAGSIITMGKAYVEVERVGKDNYINKIFTNISKLKTQPSIIRETLNLIIRNISLIIIPVGIAIFIKLYYFKDVTLNDTLLQVAANMIGMIPEGLILLTSVSLYVGAVKLAKNQTLVNELYSIETLARVDVLCLDKTGTLTSGKMSVDKTIEFDDDSYNIIANIIHNDNEDNQTSIALKKYFTIQNILAIDEYHGFNSKTKHIHAKINKHNYYLGAYEYLHVKDPKIEESIYDYACQGKRVLTFCDDDHIKALIMIDDQLREGIEKTIAYFKKQDVKIKIISGDNPLTVKNIAQRCGVEIDNYLDLSKDEITDADIYGRVKPEQKELIIEKLKNQGHIVAMVGDGNNDVLALRKADFSIALENGVDATKAISNIILLDNDFNHLNDVVNEGRRIINNITNSASLFLTKTTLSIILGFITLLFFESYPYTPIQLTILSAFGIGIPSFIVSFEPNYNRIKDQFLAKIIKNAIPYGTALSIAIVILHLGKNAYLINPKYLQTIIFIVSAVTLINANIDIFKPLNNFKRIIISFNIVGIITSYLLLDKLTNLRQLDLHNYIIAFIVSIICIILSKLLKYLKVSTIINNLFKHF